MCDGTLVNKMVGHYRKFGGVKINFVAALDRYVHCRNSKIEQVLYQCLIGLTLVNRVSLAQINTACCISIVKH